MNDCGWRAGNQLHQQRWHDHQRAIQRRRTTFFHQEQRMGQLTEHDHMKLALETAAEIEQGPPGATRAPVTATPFRGRLQEILAWLRSQNIPWSKIFAALPAILAALSSGDWLTVIQALITLFGLPANTPHPA
jgi:hypothetical protein